MSSPIEFAVESGDDAQPARYRVGMVSRLTGLSTHTLRVWERRHQAVVPERTPKGGRIYSNADVARLRQLKRLVDAGHSIGTIAHLSQIDLLGLRTADSAQTPGAPEAPPEAPARPVELRLQAVLARIDAFEIDEASQLLVSAATAYEPIDFVEQLVVPMMDQIGRRWADGRLTIAHEHAMTGVVRGLLSSMTRLYPPTVDARRAVAATLPGDRHELGIQAASLLATMHGWSVLYLGPDVPSEDIAFAVDRFQAELVMLSCTYLAAEEARSEANELAGLLPDRVRAVMGGAQAASMAPARIEALGGFSELDALLRD